MEEDLEKTADIYNKGFKSGQEHSHPSPETIKCINAQAVALGRIEEKLQSVFTITTRTEEHVEKTNGSVAKNRTAINRLYGGLSVVVVIVMPLIVYIFKHFVE